MFTISVIELSVIDFEPKITSIEFVLNAALTIDSLVERVRFTPGIEMTIFPLGDGGTAILAVFINYFAALGCSVLFKLKLYWKDS